MDSPCTSFHLRRLTRRVSSLYDQHFAASGLRGTQYSILERIARHRLVGTAALAEELGMDRSTLSRNLRPLIRAGWVIETRPAPGVLPDSRAMAVELSDAGRQKREEGFACWRRAQAEITQLLGDRTHRTLMQSLIHAYENLDEAQARHG